MACPRIFRRNQPDAASFYQVPGSRRNGCSWPSRRQRSRIAAITDKVAEQHAVIKTMQSQLRQLTTENAGSCGARSKLNAVLTEPS